MVPVLLIYRVFAPFLFHNSKSLFRPFSASRFSRNELSRHKPSVIDSSGSLQAARLGRERHILRPSCTSLDQQTIYSTTHMRSALLRCRIPAPSLRNSGAMKVQTSNLGVIQMNNRYQNQAQTRLPVEPASAPAPTYLNVFTVEEYERDGKKAKSWTKIGAAFPHKEGLGFSIELKAFPLDGRLVALPPDTDDSNRNGK